MSPREFIAKWGIANGVPGSAYALNEEQGAQSHFLDLCELLDVPKPGSSPDYRFEESSQVIGGRKGYADVFLPGVFAWENKAPGKNLDAALKQLLTYSLALSNPPLLVVSDRLTIRIHTQFTGHPSETHEVRMAELDQPAQLALLRRIWQAPESFKPTLTNKEITEAAAKSFSSLAEGLRRRAADSTQTPVNESTVLAQQRANQVAHFLTQCLFCFFAEDVGLLPGRMFERLVNNRRITPAKLSQALSDLFTSMQGGGMFGADDIPWFNGGLFLRIDVPQLSILDVTELRNAAKLNWSAIDVSIFGTLFERGLDPAKRSQLGAHYTDTATIERIIGPVVRQPLLQFWAQTAQAMHVLLANSKQRKRAAYSAGGRQFKATAGDAAFQQAEQLFITWLAHLNNYRVLDPACGSGNFLFLALKCLKDIEHRSHLDAAELGLDREADLVTGPHNVLGIELNEYAAELARVTVWIGELQWRMAHGYEFKSNPVLEPLNHIECRDALLAFLDAPSPTTGAKKTQTLSPLPHAVDPELRARQVPLEAAWPKADVVIGNPPFLGGSKKRRELGDTYFAALDTVFAGRVPGGADLVCYWFDKARQQIQAGQLQLAGLVATQSLRAGANRTVLTRLLQTSRTIQKGKPSKSKPKQPTKPKLGAQDPPIDLQLGQPLTIFNAWADEPWVNDGAAVRVSLVCFGVDAPSVELDGATVPCIHADLSSGDGLNLTLARALPENTNASFEGTKKYGDFDISGQLARQWLALPNPHGQTNALVVKPWRNGQDLSQRPSDTWVVDFGTRMSEADAALFEAPFTHVLQRVKPVRLKTKLPSNWWLHERARTTMRQALQDLPRYIATPRVSKHRHFSYLHASVLPDTRLNVIARADDTTLGLLSARMHEVWSLAQASVHGDGVEGGRPTYNTKSCFETFPFPTGLTPADTAHKQTQKLASGAQVPRLDENQPLQASATAIALAAKRLNDLRENWLNPPEWTRQVPEVTPLGMAASPYPDRTEPQPGLSEADRKALHKRTLTALYNLMPAWLKLAHQQLDLAVAGAYGWADYSAQMPDAELLKRLLTLNLARTASAQASRSQLLQQISPPEEN